MATIFPQRARRDDPNGHMVVQNNLDFLKDVVDGIIGKFKSGSATVSVGATSVIVTHGMGASSSAVSVTPTQDPGGRFWVSGKSATAFQINLQVAAPVGGIAFDYIVKGA
jgi:hypothetical protein